MSYQRVIPRDLFNEANLLKCYGQLYLKLEGFSRKRVELRHYGNDFIIEQDMDDGSLRIFNLQLYIRDQVYELKRPLNSREPWPLYATSRNYTEYAVFTDDGELTEEFLALIKDP